jgi:phosphotransferase system HPr-like phosphotransfer protein
MAGVMHARAAVELHTCAGTFKAQLQVHEFADMASSKGWLA